MQAPSCVHSRPKCVALTIDIWGKPVYLSYLYYDREKPLRCHALALARRWLLPWPLFLFVLSLYRCVSIISFSRVTAIRLYFNLVAKISAKCESYGINGDIYSSVTKSLSFVPRASCSSLNLNCGRRLNIGNARARVAERLSQWIDNRSILY